MLLCGFDLQCSAIEETDVHSPTSVSMAVLWSDNSVSLSGPLGKQCRLYRLRGGEVNWRPEEPLGLGAWLFVEALKQWLFDWVRAAQIAVCSSQPSSFC